MKYFIDAPSNSPLTNATLFILPPTAKSELHFKNLDAVKKYILTYNNETYALNNWPFLKKEHIENIKIDDCDTFSEVSIEDNVCLLKIEIVNIGHEIVNLLIQLQYFKETATKNSCKFAISEDVALSMGSYFYSVLKLVCHDKLILLKYNTKYKFLNKLYFQKSSSYCLAWKTEMPNKVKQIKEADVQGLAFYDKHEINYIKNDVNEYLLSNVNSSFQLTTHTLPTKIEKLCLIKTINSSNPLNTDYSSQRAFGKSYENFFISNGFTILNPANYNCIELYYLINNCKILVLSFGCNAFINKMLISNENIKYLLLSHIGYTHEFTFISMNYFFPVCEKACIVYNLQTELTNPSLLEDALTGLQNSV